MSYYASHYQDGQAIHAGDLVAVDDDEYLVTAVLESGEAMPQWHSWLISMKQMQSAGFLCHSWKYGPILHDKSNEEHVLIRRGVTVADPEVPPRNEPLSVQLYELGPKVRLDKLAQDADALKDVQLIGTGALAAYSPAVDQIISLIEKTRGCWDYNNYHIVPKLIIVNSKLKIGLQRNWLISNVNDYPRQFVTPLDENDYSQTMEYVLEILRGRKF